VDAFPQSYRSPQRYELRVAGPSPLGEQGQPGTWCMIMSCPATRRRPRDHRRAPPRADPLEVVWDVLGDLHRQSQAGQVGEVPPGHMAEVGDGDLALGQEDLQCGGQVRGQTEATGGVIGGAKPVTTRVC
jgi:hypothetical protein